MKRRIALSIALGGIVRRRRSSPARPARRPASSVSAPLRIRARWAAVTAATIRTTASTRRIRCPATNTVWLEEMTWMDVRDALKAGKTNIIISTGGIEPNGPWLVTGKHNYVLHANCEAIARKMGNALCAPIVKFVPEGDIEPKTSHMASPGTIIDARGHLPRRADRRGREPAGARLQEHHLHRRQRRQPGRPEGRGRSADGEVGRQGARAAHRASTTTTPASRST